MMKTRIATTTITLLMLLISIVANAQVGEYRNTLSVGANAGMTLTSVGLLPKVTQGLLPGKTYGVSARYISEKYFSMICSIHAEVNYTDMGWRENIVDLHTKPVMGVNGEAEKYDRQIGYVQVPIMAHLAWGREVKGFQFFFQAGPQFGYMLNEKTTTNFSPETANYSDRANGTRAQYGMPVENKFDYGICGGLGVEYSVPTLGHFLLEGRYYYGLANIYGATKKDYFAKSNHAAIEVKLSYLIDVVK